MIVHGSCDGGEVILSELLQQIGVNGLLRMEYRVHLFHVFEVHDGITAEYALIVKCRQCT